MELRSHAIITSTTTMTNKRLSTLIVPRVYQKQNLEHGEWALAPIFPNPNVESAISIPTGWVSDPNR